MKHKYKPVSRLISIFIALSVFTLLFSGNGIRGSDTERPNSHIHAFSILNYGICDAIQFLPDEELLSSYNPAQLSRSHNSKGLNQQKSVIFFLRNSLLLFLAAYVLYVFLQRIENNTFYSRKYIIKYIHDQDGHKK